MGGHFWQGLGMLKVNRSFVRNTVATQASIKSSSLTEMLSQSVLVVNGNHFGKGVTCHPAFFLLSYTV